jgi:predicted nucleic acid-binding protein
VRFIADTNVVSELAKPAPEPRVVEWLRHHRFAVSAITLFELDAGIQRLKGRRREQLERWLELALPGIECLPVDAQVARNGARLRAQAPQGTVEDLLIAATALAHGATLVTRNEADFARFGVRLLNPWEG